MSSEEAVEYWCGKLKSFSPLLLRASDRERQITYKTQLGIVLDELQSASKNSRSSLLAVSQAALSNVLYRIFKVDDICFGNVFSGRTMPLDGIDRLVFPTFNTVPVRINLSQYTSNADVIESLHTSSIESQNHILVPLRMIQSALGYSETRLFEVLLLVQHDSYTIRKDIWNIESDRGTMRVSFIS